MQDCISEITDLRSRLENTQSEVRELREEHQRPADEHARTIIITDEKAVEERKALEERVTKVIKEKNEIIGDLQSEIEEGRRREGELREQLAEAEGRVEARRRVIAATDDTAADSVRGESESTSETTIKSSASKHPRNGMEAGSADSIEGKVRERARSELVFNCGEGLPDVGSGGMFSFPELLIMAGTTKSPANGERCRPITNKPLIGWTLHKGTSSK